MSTLLQGAVALLLARAGGTQDVLFGATVAGRPADLPGVESMVGMFINTLPVRVEVPPRAELGGWLRRLQAEQAELHAYEHSPLVSIQGWSEIPRGVRMFDLLVVFENFPVRETPPDPAGGLGISNYGVLEQVNYPLMLEASDGRRVVLRTTAAAVDRGHRPPGPIEGGGAGGGGPLHLAPRESARRHGGVPRQAARRADGALRRRARAAGGGVGGRRRAAAARRPPG